MDCGDFREFHLKRKMLAMTRVSGMSQKAAVPMLASATAHTTYRCAQPYIAPSDCCTHVLRECALQQ
eukprot:4715173-Amphidinium_carterae.1